MRLNRILLVAVLGVAATCSMSCSSGPVRSPVQEFLWTGPTGFGGYGQTQDGFFGVCAKTDVFHEWKWDGATLKRIKGVQLPSMLRVTPLAKGLYVGCKDPGSDTAPWPMVMARLGAKDIIKKWEAPGGEGYSFRGSIGISRNRAFAAITQGDDAHWENRGFRVGILNVATKELRWVVEHRGEIYGDMREIAVSDDGKYIALPGWNHGMALVDVQAQEIRHYVRPPGVNGFLYSRFSSDGKTLFAADAAGGFVYALETKTGKVLRRWCATETGDSIYGHRISCMAVSPDDAWIAAGTGPMGQVFLFSTALPESKPVLCPHGLITTLIVSFSPDSKYMVSVAGGKIKIWATKPRTLPKGEMGSGK